MRISRTTLLTVGACLGVILGSLVSSSAHAQDSNGTWIQGSAANTTIRVDANGNAFVGVWVQAPQAVPTVQARAPMAVSLVVDTSGSMAGEKIRNARIAAASLLESLAPGDIVSIYGFSNMVTELAPPTVIDNNSRRFLMQQVNGMVSMGGTNMWDGMQAGVGRLAQAPRTHPLRRLFLISDGHANVGPSDPESLGNVAARASEWGTQVTAIGVGYDYDPQTLNAMAMRSSGRLHHLGQPSQMGPILEQELAVLSQSVAVNAYVEIVPAPGVVIVESHTPGGAIVDGHLRLPLGQVYAGQERELLFSARLPTRSLGERSLASARLVYEEPNASRAEHRQEVALHYNVARSARPTPSPRVATMIANHEANLAQAEAIAALEQGQNERAAAALARGERRLQAAAQAAPPRMRARLRSRAGRMGTESVRSREARSPAAQRQGAMRGNADLMDAWGY